jgi:hypothetical protein
MKRYRGENPALTKYLRSPWSGSRWHVPSDKKSGRRLKTRIREGFDKLLLFYGDEMKRYKAVHVPSKRWCRQMRRKGFHATNHTVMSKPIGMLNISVSV